ncbi:MAG: FAD-binding oxidoreductase [Oscillospiraceae bacterium]
MDIQKMTEQTADRLRDESRYSGFCESFSLPNSLAELHETALALWKNGTPISVSAGRTGICGACCPRGGHLLSTEKLDKILGFCPNENGFSLTAEPGVRLSQLLDFCRQNSAALGGCTLLPNPSETLATLGGLFSCNARGGNSRLHGDFAAAVLGLKILSPKGEMLELSRGERFFLDSGVDLIDLFAGSEGMLGIVTELTLALKKPAAELWGALFFFDENPSALAFGDAIIARFESDKNAAVRLGALEYFDKTAMELVNAHKKFVSALAPLPDFPKASNAALYLELEGENADEIQASLCALLEEFEALGGRESDALAASSKDECEKFRLLRHAVPEAVNAEIDRARLSDARICKLCSDFELPELSFAELFDLYSRPLSESGLRGTIFGHAASKRLHFNLLPSCFEDFLAGKKLLLELAEQIFQEGHAPGFENGIGKTKKEIFKTLGGSRREILLAAKEFFDPQGLLNPGNMF